MHGVVRLFCFCKEAKKELTAAARTGGKMGKAISEYSWEDYGISKEQYKRMKKDLEAGKHEKEAMTAAVKTEPDLAKYILISVRTNGSYEDVEYAQGRIPVCRTYFYGYRRKFYRNLLDILENCTKKD